MEVTEGLTEVLLHSTAGVKASGKQGNHHSFITLCTLKADLTNVSQPGEFPVYCSSAVTWLCPQHCRGACLWGRAGADVFERVSSSSSCRAGSTGTSWPREDISDFRKAFEHSQQDILISKLVLPWQLSTSLLLWHQGENINYPHFRL